MKGLLSWERSDMQFVEAVAEPTRLAKLVARLHIVRKRFAGLSAFFLLLLSLSMVLSIGSSFGVVTVLLAIPMLVQIVALAYVDILIKVLKLSQKLGGLPSPHMTRALGPRTRGG